MRFSAPFPRPPHARTDARLHCGLGVVRRISRRARWHDGAVEHVRNRMGAVGLRLRHHGVQFTVVGAMSGSKQSRLAFSLDPRPLRWRLCGRGGSARSSTQAPLHSLLYTGSSTQAPLRCRSSLGAWEEPGSLSWPRAPRLLCHREPTAHPMSLLLLNQTGLPARRVQGAHPAHYRRRAYPGTHLTLGPHCLY